MIASKDYEDKILEQDQIIHKLQEQIAELQETCKRLQTELEEERAIGKAEKSLPRTKDTP